MKQELEDIKQEVEQVKQEGFATELIHDLKANNKRMFIIILVVLSMWFLTIGYLIYVLNDISYVDSNNTDYEQIVEDVDGTEVNQTIGD